MRVLQLINSPLQYEPPVFSLGKLLSKKNNELICIGYWLPGLSYEELETQNYKKIRISRGDYYKLPRFFRGAIRYFRYYFAALTIAKRFNPDIVIAYGYEVLPLAWRIARSGDRIIYYCTEYSPPPTLKQYLIGWGLLKKLEKFYLQNVGTIISVEPNRATIQEKEWNRKIDFVILNTPLFDPELEKVAMSKILDEHRDIRFVYSGSISARNCLLDLVELLLDIPSISFDLYGRIFPEFQEEYEKKFRQIDLLTNGRIKYCGTVDYKYLARTLIEYEYDIGVSFYQGQELNIQLASPAKIFEYMRAGLCILSTPQPTPKEVIMRSGAGILIDINNKGDLLQTILNLVNNTTTIRQMRLNALYAFHNYYNYEQQAKELLNRF